MERLTIGFDAKRAVSNMTGLGNYSRLVIESLSATYPQMCLRLYAPKEADNPRFAKVKSLPNVSIRTPKPGEARLGKSIWRSFGIPKLLREEGIQLYHGLSNELPLNISQANLPSVVTMHDVIYRRLPECYSTIDRTVYNFKYGKSCQAATRIIAVSECTKRDVMEYYGVPEQKIDVVYQGCDDIFKADYSPDRIQEVTAKYGLSGPYIIQVGSIEARKNAMLSVRALSSLPADVQLVLVGRGTDYLKELQREARRLGVWERIKVLEGVPFTELPLLYHGARTAVYPSRYEGFGIPVLEALCCRVPCVAARGSCLEEAGGEGALYVDPNDANALSEAIRATMTNETLRNRLINEGLKHAAKFDNARIPQRLLQVYERALREYAPGCK